MATTPPPTPTAQTQTPVMTGAHMPGMFNVKTVPFNGKDYGTWQSRFKSFIAFNNKIHALADPVPAAGATTAVITDQMREDNNHVYLILSMSILDNATQKLVRKSILSTRFSPTAAPTIKVGDAPAAWDAIMEKWEPKLATDRHRLMKKFNDSVLEDETKDPAEFISDLELLHAEIEDMGHTIPDEQFLLQILYSLPPAYAVIVDNLVSNSNRSSIPLTVPMVRSELTNRYQRMLLSGEIKGPDPVSQERALFSANNNRGPQRRGPTN
jgi:gag-polypeptide of LTR copia-type